MEACDAYCMQLPHDMALSGSASVSMCSNGLAAHVQITVEV